MVKKPNLITNTIPYLKIKAFRWARDIEKGIMHVLRYYMTFPEDTKNWIDDNFKKINNIPEIKQILDYFDETYYPITSDMLLNYTKLGFSIKYMGSNININDEDDGVHYVYYYTCANIQILGEEYLNTVQQDMVKNIITDFTISQFCRVDPKTHDFYPEFKENMFKYLSFMDNMQNNQDNKNNDHLTI